MIDISIVQVASFRFYLVHEAMGQQHPTIDSRQAEPILNGFWPNAVIVQEPEEATRLRIARMCLEARRTRDRMLPGGLFSDPAWDMLLDLFIAGHLGRKVTVSDACIAAAVPTSTGLRWLQTLQKRGLTEREADSQDRRRAFVRLSPRGDDMMVNWLDRMISSMQRYGLTRDDIVP